MRPVKCPTCGRHGDWLAGKYGPFCSQRCKLVDLGKWFNGENAIPGPLQPEHLEDSTNLSPSETGRPEN